MSEFELYSFAESGNAYKAALMLTLCGADWEPRRVEFFKGETRSEAYRSLNVMGEAPVLVHRRADGDFTLSQSGAILIYLARHFGRFGHETEAEEFEILRWVLFDNHKLTSYTATERFMRHFQNKTDDPAAEFMFARAKGAWKVLETHLEGEETHYVAVDDYFPGTTLRFDSERGATVLLLVHAGARLPEALSSGAPSGGADRAEST